MLIHTALSLISMRLTAPKEALLLSENGMFPLKAAILLLASCKT